MALSGLGGAITLISLLFIKYFGRVIGATDGMDVQDHAWWFRLIGLALVPAVVCFAVFLRPHTKTAASDLISGWESMLYWLLAIASLVFMAVRGAAMLNLGTGVIHGGVSTAPGAFHPAEQEGLRVRI